MFISPTNVRLVGFKPPGGKDSLKKEKHKSSNQWRQSVALKCHHAVEKSFQESKKDTSENNNQSTVPDSDPEFIAPRFNI